jgi:hypothetical protein
MDLTVSSNIPPKWGACGGINFQSHPSVAKNFYTRAISDEIEAFCKYHEAGLMHLESWSHCLSTQFFISLDML